MFFLKTKLHNIVDFDQKHWLKNKLFKRTSFQCMVFSGLDMHYSRWNGYFTQNIIITK